jgi:PPOX class probable F420-dependent enzyme
VPSRRAQIEMSEDEVRTFLEEHRVMQVATIGPRGWPHLMPLWYVPDGMELRGWTFAKSQKARNLERDPRATVSIDDGVEYSDLRGVMLECDVEIERDPERVAEYGTALFERYSGGDPDDVREMVAKQAPKRIGLAFRPTRIVTWDHRKLAGVY